MKYGKKVCELLKDIRKQIAADNGIEYTPISCNHEGDCPGTCPQCDKELKELQDILDKKESCNGRIIINKRNRNPFFEPDKYPIVLGGCPVPTPVSPLPSDGNTNDDLPF